MESLANYASDEDLSDSFQDKQVSFFSNLSN